MAIRLGSRQDDDLVENSEINVTPFIDVMLVLLIVFMVAAPLATVDAPVDLPQSNAAATPPPEKPLFLSMKADLSLTLGNEPVLADGLRAVLDVATGARRDERIYLRADKKVAYGDLMEVMNRLRDAGYAKIALVGMETAR